MAIEIGCDEMCVKMLGEERNDCCLRSGVEKMQICIPVRKYGEEAKENEREGKKEKKDKFVNLIDLDVEEANEAFKVFEAKERIRGLKTFISQFKDRFMLQEEKLLEELEQLEWILMNASERKVFSWDLQPTNSILETPAPQDESSSIAFLKKTFFETDPQNLPDTHKIHEKTLKSWIKCEIALEFEEILSLSRFFRLVDLKKLQKLYSKNPYVTKKCLERKYYKMDFPPYLSKKFPVFRLFNSPWVNIPDKFEEICDLMEKYFIVHPSEYSSILTALKGEGIKPLLGLTWPYKITSLACLVPNEYLEKRYGPIGYRRVGVKYTIFFEEYNENAQYVVYSV